MVKLLGGGISYNSDAQSAASQKQMVHDTYINIVKGIFFILINSDFDNIRNIFNLHRHAKLRSWACDSFGYRCFK